MRFHGVARQLRVVAKVPLSGCYIVKGTVDILLDWCIEINYTQVHFKGIVKKELEGIILYNYYFIFYTIKC